MAKKILVTGGTGLIGSKLVERLKEQGHKLTVISTRERKIPGVKVFKANVKDRDKIFEIVKGHDVVFHLAAILDESLPVDLQYSVNVDGTFNVFDACLEHDVKKVIYTSSVGVYGELEKLPGDEKSPFNAISTYEKTKKEVELYIPKYKEKGLPIVILRPTIVYGPGSNMFDGLIAKVEKGSPYIGDGSNKWPLVYVDDVVDALMLAFENDDVIGEDFIISDKQAYPYKQIVKTIRRYLNKSGFVPRIPLSTLYLAASLNGMAHKFIGIPHVVTKQKVRRFVRNREFVIDKARKMLGYEPKVGLEEGMKKTVEWYLDKKFGD